MLCYVFALLHNALHLWRIVIASDSSCFKLFVGVIASNSYCSERLQSALPVSLYLVIALSNICKRYRFKGSNNIIFTIKLHCYLSIPLPYCREKRDNSVQKLYFFCKIFKSLLFLHYRITLCPNEETLLLQIVIVTYLYRFGHVCTRYRFVSLSLQENG